jgi:glycerol-3-phosphate acyltransferase PlsY
VRSAFSRALCAVGIGYLLGTIPTADVVARRHGDHDLRAEGTGNPGAANALKVLGARAGVTVMVGDIAKGGLASVAGRCLAGANGAHLAPVAAVAGHCYPVWTGFRGGKGVAASVGQCVATFPAYFPVDLAVAAATAAVPALKQRAFVATAVSSAAWVVGGVVWWRRQLPNAWGPRPGPMLPLANALSTALIMRRFVESSPSMLATTS